MWWLRDLWNSFWWNEEHPTNISYGSSYKIHRTFKTGNLALIIAIITLIIVLIKIL